MARRRSCRAVCVVIGSVLLLIAAKLSASRGTRPADRPVHSRASSAAGPTTVPCPQDPAASNGDRRGRDQDRPSLRAPDAIPSRPTGEADRQEFVWESTSGVSSVAGYLAEEQRASVGAELEMQVEEVSAAVTMTFEQSEACRRVVTECLGRHFPPDRNPVLDYERWEPCSRELAERVEALLTADQRRLLAAWRGRQERERVQRCASWTVALLDQTCGLDAGQRARIRARVGELCTQVSEAPDGQDRTAPQLRRLQDAIRLELRNDQLARFDAWAEANLSAE